MSFSTPVFMFVFLPFVLIISYFVRQKMNIKLDNYMLLFSSMLFYVWGGMECLIILLVLIGINYIFGVKIAKEESNRKKIFILSLVLNLLVLGVYKYTNFFINISNYILIKTGLPSISFEMDRSIVPLGISYFTFSIISYLIDIYKNETKPSPNCLEFATYVMMFPKIISGPIERYKDLRVDLEKRSVTVELYQKGITRFILGLSKKILLANRMGIMADAVFSLDSSIMFTGYAWLGIICYALQLYFDFSGYSDMAIGLGMLLGFNIRENFNYPYISKNIKEFWRRWHISLSTWFRDYVYIPLGGNRGGIIKKCRNVLIVFALTGLWHGASWQFIAWGCFHGVFLVLESLGLSKVLKKLPSILQRIYCIIVVLVGWVFFRADGLNSAIAFIKNMFVINMNGIANPDVFSKITIEFIFIFVISLFAVTPLFKKISDQLALKCKGIYQAVLLILFVIVLGFMLGDSFNPFIYFKF